MKILLIGSGGREHALAWRLAQSKECSALYCAPGNAGISECADLVPIEASDIDGLVTFARRSGVDLVIVGPEIPLVAGLVDRLAEVNIKAFGPTAAAARLEGAARHGHAGARRRLRGAGHHVRRRRRPGPEAGAAAGSSGARRRTNRI